MYFVRFLRFRGTINNLSTQKVAYTIFIFKRCKIIIYSATELIDKKCLIMTVYFFIESATEYFKAKD